MAGSTEHWLTVAGDTLTVQGQLGLEEYDEFERALLGVARARTASIVIDLTNVEHIVSPYIGLVSRVGAHAVTRGTVVRVRANGHILRLLTVAGLGRTLTLETPDGEQPLPID